MREFPPKFPRPEGIFLKNSRGSREFWLGNSRKNPGFLASFAGERQITNDAAFWLPLVKPEHFTWLDDESNILENHVFEQIQGHLKKNQVTGNLKKIPVSREFFFPVNQGISSQRFPWEISKFQWES